MVLPTKAFLWTKSTCKSRRIDLVSSIVTAKVIKTGARCIARGVLAAEGTVLCLLSMLVQVLCNLEYLTALLALQQLVMCNAEVNGQLMTVRR